MQGVFKNIKSTDVEFKKIKSTDVEIIVDNPQGKYGEAPYYCIRYYDISNKKTYIGFGSYNLDFVRQWKEEYFEIVNQVEEEFGGEELRNAKNIHDYIKMHINPYGKPFKGTVYEFGLKVMDYIESLANNNQSLTNADKIRSMTDEELAEILFAGCVDAMGKSECAEFVPDCKKCILAWLRSKVEE